MSRKRKTDREGESCLGSSGAKATPFQGGLFSVRPAQKELALGASVRGKAVEHFKE